MRISISTLFLSILFSLALPAIGSAETVLITGSNRGIGFAFVEAFAQKGWIVIATTRNPDRATDLLALSKKYPSVKIEKLDVTNQQQTDSLAEKYQDIPIDILLNNAAVTPYDDTFSQLEELDMSLGERSLLVNALGPLRVSQAFIDNVMASEIKLILTISAKAGTFSNSPKAAMMYHYRASKVALNMYMLTLSYETKKTGVTTVMMAPGRVNTRPDSKFKLPKAISPDQSVALMMEQIEKITPDLNGKFIDNDGTLISF